MFHENNVQEVMKVQTHPGNMDFLHVGGCLVLVLKREGYWRAAEAASHYILQMKSSGEMREKRCRLASWDECH